jgi:hypothetical protein
MFVATHGMSQTKENSIWRSMKDRCCNSNNKTFSYYGGRGIYVCERWRNSFENFFEDMGYCPEGLTLDRIDNDGPYSPDNCRWATLQEQGRNRRDNHWIEYNGESHTLVRWSEILNLSYSLLISRLNKHKWSVKRAFETPYIPSHRRNEKALNFITYCNKTQTLSEWARELNVSPTCLWNRLYRKKMPIEEALSLSSREGVSVFLTYKGKTQTLSEWSREIGINKCALSQRLNEYKWSVEKALSTPLRKGNYNNGRKKDM